MGGYIGLENDVVVVSEICAKIVGSANVRMYIHILVYTVYVY